MVSAYHDWREFCENKKEALFGLLRIAAYAASRKRHLRLSLYFDSQCRFDQNQIER
jgi:hypothetical protein